MASVTQRIKQVQQPYGGYVPIRDFEVKEYKDGIVLGEENIHASIIGIVVDYLTRYMQTRNAEDAFKISLEGARLAERTELAIRLLDDVTGLDDQSIIAACQLAGFDVCFRAGMYYYKPVEDIIPDESTIENVRVMVKRSLLFWKDYGPIVKDGFTFEGGYTAIVNAGDGDFLTGDTLWDFKVSKSEPNKNHTLQLLMYYIMGLRSKHLEFKNIHKLGIFNPRLNKVYTINISNISDNIIEEVSTNVLGYNVRKSYIQKKMDMDKNVYTDCCVTVSEVVERLNISKTAVYKLIRSEKLLAEKKGNKYYVSISSLEEYEEQLEKQRRWALISGVVTIILIVLLWFVMF